jgi:hypothetical protein
MTEAFTLPPPFALYVISAGREHIIKVAGGLVLIVATLASACILLVAFGFQHWLAQPRKKMADSDSLTVKNYLISVPRYRDLLTVRGGLHDTGPEHA